MMKTRAHRQRGQADISYNMEHRLGHARARARGWLAFLRPGRKAARKEACHWIVYMHLFGTIRVLCLPLGPVSMV